VTFRSEGLVWLDQGGRGPGLVPAAEAALPVGDRGLLYGDGLFETVLIRSGGLPLLELHLERLAASALALGIPCDLERVRAGALALAGSTGAGTATALAEQALRITLTRGVAASRGYAPPAEPSPTVLITRSPYQRPAGPLRTVTAGVRVWSESPLWRHKTLSALEKVLARAEAVAAGADEALLLNQHGRLAEGASANLFVVQDGRWITPPVSEGCLPGVMRRRMIALTGARQEVLPPEALAAAHGVYLTSALMGCLPVSTLDGRPLRLGPPPPRLEELLGSGA